MRRHTRCALVSRVQTFALPIACRVGDPKVQAAEAFDCPFPWSGGSGNQVQSSAVGRRWPAAGRSNVAGVRSEERRVGKECVSPCRSRWCAYHETKQKKLVTYKQSPL